MEAEWHLFLITFILVSSNWTAWKPYSIESYYMLDVNVFCVALSGQ